MLVYVTAPAGIYKWVDEDGNIHYSDQEVKGSEQVELPKAVTYTPESTPPLKSSKPTPKDQHPYTKMDIVQPKMNETFRINSGDVAVAIELTPPLRKGDSITLYLDGKVVKKGVIQTSTSLSKVERGSHTIRATVLDNNGTPLISSSSVIFHLRVETTKSESNAPEDNSEAYTPNYKKDNNEEADYDKDYSKDYSDDFSKDYDSSNTYKDGAEKYKTGIPSNTGNFKPGSSTYSPNYNQKK